VGDSVPHEHSRSHSRFLVPLALAGAIGLLATACQSAPSQVARTAALRLVITPASGSAGVKPGDPITVKATGGKIKTVTVSGDTVTGALDQTGAVWRSNSTLPVQKTMTVSVTAANRSGKTVTRTSTFRTLRPKRTFSAKITEGYRQTYGVGMPIILTFSRPIRNRQAVERSLEITTSKPVVGAWNWDNSQTVAFRPRDYWPAHTSVSFVARLNGVEVAPGVYGHHTLSQQFTIGRSLIVVASTTTHRLKLYRNGRLIDNWPISSGRPGDDTPNGTYLTMWKGNPVRMTGPGYSLEVPWSVDFTASGNFLHDAYWSVGVQGFANVSHGCVNMAPADAERYYKMEHPGDPVTITGSPRPGVWDNGWTQWFMTWPQYLRGSALHQAVVAGPNGSTFVDPATLAASTATAPLQKSRRGNARAD
jgi:lipoprotein-anchoring transpeptidase ErfK/SrfK